MFKKVWVANHTKVLEMALLDTGAGVSLIDYTLAHQLGLSYTGKIIPLRGVSGQPFYAREALAQILIPESNTWNWQPVYVPDISVQVDGRVIVGRDYMKATKLSLEYGNGETVRSKKEGAEAPPIGLILIGLVGVALGILGLLAIFGSSRKE